MIELKAYRGHIRNHKDLCNILDIDPSLPREKCEEQILIKAYEKWNKKMADHLHGMFAFAIWDTEEEKLFCLRDHFGTKPFYYYVTEDNHGYGVCGYGEALDCGSCGAKCSVFITDYGDYEVQTCVACDAESMSYK